ncbi:MAG: ATP-binding protein [Actinomycetota bacterium]|nr:ATP-binding protein [Actinomycetota bacterium]
MFAASPRSPALAREYCADQLGTILDAGSETDRVVATTQLIVSELVTNSVNAGGSNVIVELSLQHSRLRIAVRDDAPGRPRMRLADAHDERGRGLPIVDTLSARWGTEMLVAGKQVWAELALSG